MKVISRTSERTLMRKLGEPHYQPWSEWEVCEGTEGLTLAECRMFIEDVFGHLTWGVTKFDGLMVDPYCREEFRIVEDSWQGE